MKIQTEQIRVRSSIVLQQMAAGGGGTVEQGTRRVDEPAGADRRYSEAAVPWLRCHAQAGFWFSRDPSGGKVTTLHRWMEEAQDRHPFTGALCPNFETGPKRSGSGRKQTVEERAGGRTHKPTQKLKMLKRQMYGRAGIELLRARLLPEPAFSGP
jgi:hypothetical protein